MVNHEIARILRNMAAYLQMGSEQQSFFKSRAFQKAADIITKLQFDLSNKEWRDKKKLIKIDGVGDTVANYILEYVKTGKIKDYERMKKENPVNLEELLDIQGIGVKTIQKLYKELGVVDLKSLEEAAKSGKISELEGFGEKTTRNILDSIEYSIMDKNRMLISDAEFLVNELVSYLKKYSFNKRIEAVGSYRRKRPTIGDIDILVASSNAQETMDRFADFPSVEKVLLKGNTKTSVWLKSKVQVDLRVVKEEEWGSSLQYFTGSKAHNVRLRNLAIKKGYKLSEYGLFDRKTNVKIEGKSEKKIYKKLGLQFIPPELREDNNEIEYAQKSNLPKLITLDNLEGDLQMHTTFSDGVNTVKEMAEKGISLGYKYIGITDHFGNLPVANPVQEKDFDEYISTIKRVNKQLTSIRVLAGAEVEVDRNGNLGFNEDFLSQLDYVVAGIHLNTKMDNDSMTQRILKVIRNPLVKILAHPTGRILGRRKGYEFDYEAVFKEAAVEDVAIEINAQPSRLDISDELVRLCKKTGAKIVINTDAHSTQEMDFIKYGVYVARRGWITKENIYKPKF